MGAITPGYLETMGIRYVGVAPTWDAVEAGTGPTVITSAFARRYWEQVSAIGHGIKPFNSQYPYFPVAAVTEDIRANGPQNPPIQEVYFPLIPPQGVESWNLGSGLSLVVKAPAANTETLVRDIRGALAQVEPNAVIADIQPMEVIVASSMAETSFTMLLMVLAAAIALTLSAVGIYGVISYVVGQRRGEIGIRIALGAQVEAVAWLVVGQSLAIVGVGAAIGLVGALAGTRLLRSLLFDVSPTDPFVLAATVLMLLMVAMLASVGPVRRAARVDPAEVLRD